MLEIGEHTFFTGLQIHSLSDVATVIADAEIARFSCFEANDSTSLGTNTTTEDVACVLEIASLVITVAYAPPLLDERRE